MGSATAPTLYPRKLQKDSMKGMLSVHDCPTCSHRYFSCGRPADAYKAIYSKRKWIYALPLEERASIAENLGRLSSEMDALNDEIEQLHSRIEQAKELKYEIEKAFDYHLELLSPMGNLPEDILIEILKWCVSGGIDVCFPNSGVWQLEKVCKRWRDIMRSTPTIWSSMDIFLPLLSSRRSRDSLAKVEHAVKQCITLSKDTSLSIQFLEIGLPEHFKHVMNILSSSSYRWKDLSFSMSMVIDPPVLEYGLTRLRSLRLSGAYKGVLPFNSFQSAQRLSELRLFSFLRPFYTLNIPWHQLRYFHAHHCDFRTGEFAEMLRHMPRIVNFCLQWNRGLEKNVNPTEAITFQSLQNLTLEAPLAEICTVLQLLSVPALEELNLTVYRFEKDPRSQYMADKIVAMIDRSLTYRLSTLSLSFVNAACVSRVLEVTPNLSKLILWEISDVELVLRELYSSDNVVPHLRDFSLACGKRNQAMSAIGPLEDIVQLRGLKRDPGIGSPRPGALHILNLRVRVEVSGQFMQLQPLCCAHGVIMNIEPLE